MAIDAPLSAFRTTPHRWQTGLSLSLSLSLSPAILVSLNCPNCFSCRRRLLTAASNKQPQETSETWSRTSGGLLEAQAV